MTLLWTDGMDRYTTAADVGNLYSGTLPTSWQSAAGINGGGAFRYSGTGGSSRTFSTAGVVSAGNGFHGSVWLKPGGFSQAQSFFHFGDGFNALILQANTNASISVLRWGDGAVAETSAANTLTSGLYVNVELAAKVNSAANGGYVKVWVDGNLVINFAGDTSSIAPPTAFTAVRIGKSLSGASSVWDFDDLICWDEQGSDFALTQLSTAYTPEIETLSVDGDDAVQFTPLSGSNFQNVDETGYHDSDTTYNSSSTTGHQDLLTLANQSGTPSYTFAVVVKTWAKIQTAGTTTFRLVLDSGGTVVETSDNLLTTVQGHWQSYYGKDPNTSAVWGTSAINSVKVGYKNQSVT